MNWADDDFCVSTWWLLMAWHLFGTPDNKVHEAYMGPTWGRQVGPMLALWTLLSGTILIRNGYYCEYKWIHLGYKSNLILIKLICPDINRINIIKWLVNDREVGHPVVSSWAMGLSPHNQYGLWWASAWWNHLPWYQLIALMTHPIRTPATLHTFRPRQNGGHFADDNFKLIFVNENCCILIAISRVCS